MGFAAVPPQSGEESSGGIGDHIAWVAGGVGEPKRAEEFAENGPDGEVKEDFTGGRDSVVGAETELAVKEKHEG